MRDLLKGESHLFSFEFDQCMCYCFDGTDGDVTGPFLPGGDGERLEEQVHVQQDLVHVDVIDDVR